MKRKILVLSITFLTLVMLTTPVISGQGVRRNVSQPFFANAEVGNPDTDPPGSFGVGTVKFVGTKDSDVLLTTPSNPENRKYRMETGTKTTGVISTVQLGDGVMTGTVLMILFDMETGMGWGVSKWKWEFDNDDCVGTIEGIEKKELVIDLTVSPPHMHYDGNALLCKGTGNLQNVKIQVSYEADLNMATYTTEGFIETMEGTIWGWNP